MRKSSMLIAAENHSSQRAVETAKKRTLFQLQLTVEESR
jgi:hypothetical protein